MVNVFTIFTKEDDFYDFLFAFLHAKPLLKKGSDLRWRLPYKIDPFSEGRQNYSDRFASSESVSIFLNP